MSALDSESRKRLLVLSSVQFRNWYEVQSPEVEKGDVTAVVLFPKLLGVPPPLHLGWHVVEVKQVGRSVYLLPVLGALGLSTASVSYFAVEEAGEEETQGQTTRKTLFQTVVSLVALEATLCAFLLRELVMALRFRSHYRCYKKKFSSRYLDGLARRARGECWRRVDRRLQKVG